jgi:hypothetical protein
MSSDGLSCTEARDTFKTTVWVRRVALAPGRTQGDSHQQSEFLVPRGARLSPFNREARLTCLDRTP